MLRVIKTYFILLGGSEMEVKCANCNKVIEDFYIKINIDDGLYYFHVGCDYIPKEHLEKTVRDSK